MQEDPQEESTPAPSGDGAKSVEQQDVVDVPIDSFERSVLGELEKIRNPQGNWIQALLILAVSLLLFLGLGMRNDPIAFTVMLVGILLFHEMGHYVGMRFFGYRNVRMFFIPFFGAAVSGRRTDAKSYQEAIVTLLGPLPGLCVSLALWGLASVSGIGDEARRNLLWASLLFGFINGFNLLPIFPLDGGRLLNQILFSRNRHLEGLFQLLAALAFIAYGAARQRPFLIALGASFVMHVGPRFKTNSIAQRIGGRLGDQLPPMNEPIPLLIVRATVAQVKSSLPGVKTARGMAATVFNIWEKMHVRPPGAFATMTLLLVYLAGALLAYPAASNMIRLPFGGSSVQRWIENFASEANKHLPRQIDKVTRCDRVVPGPGKAFSYIYTLSRELTEEHKRALRENTTRRALAAPSMQAMFDAGITVRYKYYDSAGKEVFEFPVRK
jgi:Zn-dependent protease